VALANRMFRVVLLGLNPQAKIDAQNDVTLADVFDNHRENARVGDVAARLQVIGDPTKPFGIRDRLFQFFVVEGSRQTVRENLGAGVLYEISQDGEAPIAFVNRDELGMMISGEGFTITVPYSAEEPAAPPPVLEGAGAAQAVSLTDKDANGVPDAQEYVDGDPDKGVRSDLGVDRVALVGGEQTAKAGTVTAENQQGAPELPQGGAMVTDQGSTVSRFPVISEEDRAAAQAEPDPASAPAPTGAAAAESEPDVTDQQLEDESAEEGDIASLTSPSKLAERFTREELKGFAQEKGIDVKRSRWTSRGRSLGSTGRR
jgi:hypothetical protein